MGIHASYDPHPTTNITHPATIQSTSQIPNKYDFNAFAHAPGIVFIKI